MIQNANQIFILFLARDIANKFISFVLKAISISKQTSTNL